MDAAMSNTTSEVVDSLKGSIKERITSPFFSAFVTSWSLINFRFFLIFFSDSSLRYKFKLFDWYFSTYSIWETLIYPLVATLSYIFLYPYIARPINLFLLRQKLQIQRDIFDAEGRQLVDENRLKGIYANFYDERKRFEDRIGVLQHENLELRSKLEAIERVSMEKNLNVGTPLEGLDEAEVKMIHAIGTYEEEDIVLTEDSLAQELKFGRVKTADVLQNLVDASYVSRRSYGDDFHYGLQPKGRKAYLFLTSSSE